MAQLAIAAIGAAVGGAIAPGVVALGLTGASIGWTIGSVIGAQFGPRQKIGGPRIEDLKVTGVEYGQPIPWIAGHPRISGQIWWASDKRETATTSEVGKGGGGAEVTSYTYDVDLLIGLCDREIAAVTRIWSNGKLIWTALSTSDYESILSSQVEAPWSRMTIYTGASTQLPDPTYEEAVGVGNAPAYRGRGSVFIEGLQLGSSGQLPNLTFEVAVAADADLAQSVLLVHAEGSEGSTAIVDSSANNRAVTAFGSAAISGVRAKFGTSSIALDGSGDYLVWNLSPAVTFSGDLTVECWFWANTTDTTRALIGLMEPAGGSNPDNMWLVERNASGKLIFFVGSSTLGFNRIVGTTTADPGMWHHARLTREMPGPSTATFKLWLNGQLQGTWSTTSGGFQTPWLAMACHKIIVGSYYGTGEYWLGYVDEIRVLNGVAANTASFDPPTLPFADVSQYTISEETLRDVVEALCDRAGLPAGSYDASALDTITKPIRAMAIGQVTPARTVLEQLASAYFFDTYLADKLYFVPRGGSAAATIPAEDLGCGEEEPAEEALPKRVGNDSEIPAQIALSYSNADADYNTATEHSDRLLSAQLTTNTVQLPIAFTAAEAKGIVDAMLADAFAGRIAGEAALGLQYCRHTPTDVLMLTDSDGSTYRARVVRVTHSGPLVQIEWVLDDASALSSAGVTSSDYAPSLAVALPGNTALALMDIPILRDADDAPGIYAAAKPSSGTVWPGAALMSSVGGDYSEVGRFTSRGVFGVTTTALTSWTGGNVFDEGSSVTVDVGDGELSSSTRDAMLGGEANALLVGNEIVQFRTATLVTPGVYTLTGFLRGRRGTEWAMTGHAIGETVVLLRTAGLVRVSYDAARIGQEVQYRGVTFGKPLASAIDRPFTDTGRALQPFSPVDARAERLPNGDISISWKRRTRLSTRLTGPAGIVAPEDFSQLQFTVRLYRDATRSSLVRTLTSTSSSATYSASQVATDLSLYQDGVLYASITQVNPLGQESRALNATLSPDLSPGGSAVGTISAASMLMPFGGANLTCAVQAVVGGAQRHALLETADDGITWAAAYSGLTSAAQMPGVDRLDAATSSLRISVGWNYSPGAAPETSITTIAQSSNSSAPVTRSLHPKVGGTGAYIYPYALYADTTTFYLVGRAETDAISGSGLYLYTCTDGVSWALQGNLTQDASDPNLITAQYGAFNANLLSGIATGGLARRLVKIASRWFLCSPFAIYYSDDSTALSNWRRCPTGLGEGSTNPWPSLASVLQLSSKLVVVRRDPTSGNCVAYSSDSGETWTRERPAGLESFAFITAAYIAHGKLVLYVSDGRIFTTAGLPGGWSSSAASGLSGSPTDFVGVGSRAVCLDAVSGQGYILRTSADSVTWAPATVSL